MPKDDTGIKKDVAHSSLPQLLCNTRKPIIGGSLPQASFLSRQKQIFCHSKIYMSRKHHFTATSILLLRQKKTCFDNKHVFVLTKLLLQQK